MTKSAKQEKYDVPKLAFSIPEFCVAHGISESHFYGMRDRGHGPREMRFGNRVMISVEAAADWRRRMEIENSEETPREGHLRADIHPASALPPTPPEKTSEPKDDLVTIDRVCKELGGEKTPFHRATIYKMMHRGACPKPLKVGGSSRWVLSEIHSVKAAMMAAR